MTWTLAPNIAQINQTVRGTSWMRDLGTIGDTSHQKGAGDHTPWSTHVGKYGYPTQGQVHAQDVGASDYMLDLIETFIRRSWRRGELSGLKYFNVLNRHWNIQSWTSWNQAQNGTIQPTYSSDHHLHLSMENGSIDGDILDRFIRWYNNGQQFEPAPTPQPEEEEDTMYRVEIKPGYPAENGNEFTATGKTTVVSVPEATQDRWVKVSFSCDWQPVYLRVAINVGSYWDVQTIDVTPEGNRIYQGIDLPVGANKVSIARLSNKGGVADTPLDMFVEFGKK